MYRSVFRPLISTDVYFPSPAQEIDDSEGMKENLDLRERWEGLNMSSGCFILRIANFALL